MPKGNAFSRTLSFLTAVEAMGVTLAGPPLNQRGQALFNKLRERNRRKRRAR